MNRPILTKKEFLIPFGTATIWGIIFAIAEQFHPHPTAPGSVWPLLALYVGSCYFALFHVLLILSTLNIFHISSLEGRGRWARYLAAVLGGLLLSGGNVIFLLIVTVNYPLMPQMVTIWNILSAAISLVLTVFVFRTMHDDPERSISPCNIPLQQSSSSFLRSFFGSMIFSLHGNDCPSISSGWTIKNKPALRRLKSCSL